MRKLIGCALLVLSLAGCSTVTKETVNTTPQDQPQVSATLQKPEFKGLKRKVAIARFSNETSAGASFLLDKNNDRIGKQASDILAARLVETQKFIMLERQDLVKLKDEAALQGTELKSVGADYLIIGSVSEYGREAISETGIFSRNKKQLARVKINVRLVDVKSGQIIYSEEGAGEAYSEANKVFGVGASAGYDSSLDDKALSAAITKLISNLVENLMDKPWQAYFISQESDTYIMTGGISQGVRVGDQFAVLERGKRILNPQTGLSIELPGKRIAQIEVLSQSGNGDNEVSFTAVQQGSLAGKEISSLVIQEL